MEDSEGEDYEIEKILDHKTLRSGTKYLIHWLGYPDTDNEWVHEGYIEAKDLIADYWGELQAEEERSKD